MEKKKITGPLEVGTAIMMIGDEEPFSTYIVLGEVQNNVYKICRPYAYASGLGSMCVGHLLGAEVMEVTLKQLCERFDLLVGTKGDKRIYKT